MTLFEILNNTNVKESDNYTAPEYVESSTVSLYKNQYRFGHTDDILLFVNGSSAENHDYVIGIIAFSIAILVLFIMLLGVIIKVKYLKNTSEQHDQLMSSNTRRKIFILCGIASIVSSSIFMSIGLNSLNETMIGVKETLARVDVKGYDVLDIVDSLESTAQDVKKIQEDLNSNPSCFGTIDKLVEALTNIYSGVQSKVIAFRSCIEVIFDATFSLTKKINDFDWLYPLAVSFGSIQIILTSFFILSTFPNSSLSLSPPRERGWLIYIYLFFIFSTVTVLLSCILACIFNSAVVGGSDFCSDSPDKKVTSIVEFHGQVTNLDALDILKYYVEGCTNYPKLLNNLDSILLRVITALDLVHNLGNRLTNMNNTLFNKVCGNHSLKLVNSTNAVIENLGNIVDDSRKLLFCSNWNPSYVQLMHEDFCQKGLDGFGTIFITQFLIVVLSMIMASLYPLWREKG